MAIEVHTDDLLEAADRLRRIGRRVTSYADAMDGRATHVARDLDDDVARSLSHAWAEVARAVEALSTGFQVYGAALADVASSFEQVEDDLTREVPGLMHHRAP